MMNAPAKIQLDFETVAEAMQREGIHRISDWRPVGTQNAFSVELKDGRRACGVTIRDALEKARKVSAMVAA